MRSARRPLCPAWLRPERKKARSQPQLLRARAKRLSTFHCDPLQARLPEYPQADHRLPADSAAPTPVGDPWHPAPTARSSMDPTPACLTLWDGEDFQGRHCRLLNACANISERSGLRRVRSVKVESGAWVGFEYPDFQGQQFILEKGDYPRWNAWSGSSSVHSNQLLSFQPVLGANHSDSHVTLFEGENFQGCRFELSDDYPSLSAMGWARKDVGSLKVSSGAWVAYQYPGYRGYQYVLERDRHSGEFRTYSKFGTQAHTGQLQSIRRVQH
ncbi:beta-crystallin A2 [Elephas maximus indicus]|uniref:beta-crystallin A2 n=1 Tax=Elephas maximus indicus TaxID=99487 RepID=UPI002116CD95|nr:beta-crystallin A2 [Elephas maximus indicus]